MFSFHLLVKFKGRFRVAGFTTSQSSGFFFPQVEVIKKLLNYGVTKDQIIVLSPYRAQCHLISQDLESEKLGLSAGTGKRCVVGHLGLVFIWSCFVFCLLFLLFYIISAPVLVEAAEQLSDIPVMSIVKSQGKVHPS